MAEAEIRADIEELQKLCDLATRQKVKDVLNIEIRKLQTDLSKRFEQGLGDSSEQMKPEKKESVPPKKYYKQLDTYAWDQSDKFMKIYVTLSGVQNIEKSNVTSQYTDSSLKLTIDDLDGKNYQLGIGNLSENIVPDSSYHKVKSDMVLLMLKKAEEKKTWPYVTQKDKKSKEKDKPAIDDKKDPNDSLMDMMKKMYDEGDDEMKRTIAKAWTENRNKQESP